MIVKAMPVSPPPVMVPNSVLVKPKCDFPLAQHLAAHGKTHSRRDQGQKAGPKDFAIGLHCLGLQRRDVPRLAYTLFHPTRMRVGQDRFPSIQGPVDK